MNQTNEGKPKRKIGQKVLRIVGIILTVIAILLLSGTALQNTYFKGKLENIKPYGQLVQVQDGQIHVYCMGDGEKTIVLLPGLGVPLPSADFGPLMRKLSEHYTVVCIEYFGVGFSSETATERTCENYVEEIRTTLNQSGFQAPYVLMPHSISNIYCEYYAANYPNEVEAIISLDGTSTAFHPEVPANVQLIGRIQLSLVRFLQKTGILSLLASLPQNHEAMQSYGLTEKEADDYITFSGFSFNDVIVEQNENAPECTKQTMDLPFPSSVPYFKIISRQTYEFDEELEPFHITAQEYQRQHLERIGQHAQYEILEGSHFIYYNNVEKIAEITDAFLLRVDQ